MEGLARTVSHGVARTIELSTVVISSMATGQIKHTSKVLVFFDLKKFFFCNKILIETSRLSKVL